MEPTALILAAAIVVAGLVIAFVFALTGRGSRRALEEASRQSDNRAQALERSVSNLMANQNEIGGRMGQLAEIVMSTKSQLSQQFEERLEAINHRVGQSLLEQQEKTSQSLGSLNERLAVIDDAQRNITELSGQVVSLQDILSNKQARGVFGEVQLADLIGSVLAPSTYQLQAQLSNGRRADCLVQLPNPPGPIVIDAKFPLESYRALQAAKSEEERRPAQRRFRTDVLAHVKAIAERYLIPGETAESALMFLPSEAVYAELHASFQDVVDEAFKARVWIVSPTTLMATLVTVRGVLKDARTREQAHVIQREVTQMLGDVERLAKRAAALDKHFKQAEADVSGVLTSTKKIVRRMEKIEEIQVSEELPEGTAEATAPAPVPAADTPAEAPLAPPEPTPAVPTPPANDPEPEEPRPSAAVMPFPIVIDNADAEIEPEEDPGEEAPAEEIWPTEENALYEAGAPDTEEDLNGPVALDDPEGAPAPGTEPRGDDPTAQNVGLSDPSSILEHFANFLADPKNADAAADADAEETETKA